MGGGEVSYLKFGYEDVFKTEVNANKAFGTDAVIRSLDVRNNIKRLHSLGYKDATRFIANRFEGALGIEFSISDPWFLKGVLGGLTTSGGAVASHYFYGSTSSPPSMTIINGIDMQGVTSNAIRKYLGCIVSEARISIAEGDEPARCSLTILYANEVKTHAGLSGALATTDMEYPWTYGDFEYPAGTSVANTESVELTINNNGALKWGLGSRIASRRDYRERTFDISTTNYFDDPATYLEKTYGQTTGPMSSLVSGETGCNIILSNGLTSTELRRIIMYVSGAIIDHHSLPQAVESEFMETVDIFGKSLAIAVTNNTAAMP